MNEQRNKFVPLMQVMVVGFFLTFPLSIASANSDKNKKDSYKENKKISSLLEKEKFQVGLSCDDAMKAYKLDVKQGKGKRVRINSSLIGFGEEQTLKTGFYRGSCLENKLEYADKIVSVNDGKRKNNAFFDSFIKQYGKPSFQRDGLSNIRYYIILKGVYAEFSVSRRIVGDKTATVYELEDLTSRFNK